MSVAKYTIVNPNDPHPFPESHKITVRVTSVESGQFSFQAAEAGDYMTCFWALDHKPQSTITIDFDWKTGVAAKDWTNVAKKGTIDVLDTANRVHDPLIFFFF
ncbi:Transmembrane emp24 domain-containing protein p24delta9, partial [Camellia lanceoleosa]